MGDELGESRSPDQGDSRRGGVLAICAESPACAGARVHGRTCRHGKGVLRGQNCRRCGHSIVGIGIWTIIYMNNCTE